MGLPNALPPALFSSDKFPKTFAWIDRFSAAVTSAGTSVPKPATLEGSAAIRQVLQADYLDNKAEVDERDPTNLKKGQEVEVWPLDSGSNHRDRGRLVALSPSEVVITAKTQHGQEDVRIHFPRINFRLQAVSRETGIKL